MPEPSNQHPGTALITGAADRIGAAMAERLAAAGWRVVVHYRASAEKAAATVARISASGGSAVAVGADLTDRSQRQTLVARAAAAAGSPLTCLINNASLFIADALPALAEAEWDQHFALHVEAPAFLARDLAAQLPADAEGNVINIIDSRVLRLAPSYFSYTLSKTTLWSMTQTMAQALAPRIRVNAIGPGPTLPEAGQPAETFARSQASTLLGHSGGPLDISDALMFLISARNVTGQMISVDGGKHLGARPSGSSS